MLLFILWAMVSQSEYKNLALQRPVSAMRQQKWCILLAISS